MKKEIEELKKELKDLKETIKWMQWLLDYAKSEHSYYWQDWDRDNRDTCKTISIRDPLYI